MANRFDCFRSTFAFAFAVGATLLVVAGSAAPVHATPMAMTEAPRIAIRTQGVDLLSPAGAARIQTQIGRAARIVCTTGDVHPAFAAARAQCIKTALASARSKVATLSASARDARMAVADAAQAAPLRR